MKEKLLNLLLLFVFFLVVESNLFSNGASREANRAHNRRSTFWDSLPGQPGQILPGDVVQWTVKNQKCNGKEIMQNITQPGCQPVSIRNKICYGLCGSIFVPNVPGSKETVLCTQCRPGGPKKAIAVNLKCDGGKIRTVNVNIVERCLCSPCDGPSRTG